MKRQRKRISFHQFIMQVSEFANCTRCNEFIPSHLEKYFIQRYGWTCRMCIAYEIPNVIGYVCCFSLLFSLLFFLFSSGRLKLTPNLNPKKPSKHVIDSWPNGKRSTWKRFLTMTPKRFPMSNKSKDQSRWWFRNPFQPTRRKFLHKWLSGSSNEHGDALKSC